MSYYKLHVIVTAIINGLIYIVKVAVTAIVAGGILRLMGVL